MVGCFLGRARLKLAMERAGPEKARQLQLENARLDYEYAEKLRGTAEACNALGLIALQRRMPGTEPVKTSVSFFKLALQREPHYPPALLNLAIVLQSYLNESREALDTYREYPALQPVPPQAKEVEKLARQLDFDLRITIYAAPIPPRLPHPQIPTLNGRCRHRLKIQFQNPRLHQSPRQFQRKSQSHRCNFRRARKSSTRRQPASPTTRYISNASCHPDNSARRCGQSNRRGHGSGNSSGQTTGRKKDFPRSKAQSIKLVLWKIQKHGCHRNTRPLGSWKR